MSAERPRTAAAWVAVLALVATTGAAAQADPTRRLGPGGFSGAAATRSVSRYGGLEQALLDAVAQGQRPAVLAVLDEGFEVRHASSAEAVPASEWLAQELARPRRGAHIRRLAVREWDDLAIVSFLIEGGGLTLFVVDVWRASTGLLLSRQTAAAAGLAPTPTRPDGRG